MKMMIISSSELFGSVSSNSVKYQLKRDGYLYGRVYDTERESREVGELLVSCGWIKVFEVVPVAGKWMEVSK